ncbi:hypothetical protein DY000_02043331 [Brassica cretica]|uniref:Large ribosomal subunit protein bL31c n=1 Tax=Brassica cretica TaxID=69181 RepID=A0ABQ7BKT5_BRACR|nr:hypothetical protein DY000_02043331 [Brassica cretica]
MESCVINAYFLSTHGHSNCDSDWSEPRDSKPAVVQVMCRKKGLHPEFHEDAKVYCNGELVMTTGGTKKEYVTDVWSVNHPFYLGNRSAFW